MSLLTVIQNACAELSIPIPGLVAANPDPTIVQLKALSKRGGDEMARKHDWSTLRILRSFTTTGAYPEPTAFPADFERFAQNSQIWNNSRLWNLNGPVDGATWQRNTIINTQPVPQIWRILSGDLDIYPNTAGETISFEYISKNWITLAAGGTGSNWANDNDVAIVPERVLELSVIYRWKKAKGLDYAEAFQDYKDALESDVGSDRSAMPASLSMPNRGQVPDNFWPGMVVVTP